MRQVLAITKKELDSYFGSLLAIIFLGVFLGAVLFVFFYVETFFARGIADVRPMFEWMPVLTLFLLAALTMRQWSEEQRSGTMEILLTLPVNCWQLVLGKFLAVMTIMATALAMTLPIPILVSQLGNLDWGPVFGGYLAAVLMSGAYAAIGLFVSSRTDNQIVSLIITMFLGGIFYLFGTKGVTSFTSGTISEILRALGTGSRFESIQRGVIDLRDLVYYLSLAGVFLLLNVVSLDALRWSKEQKLYRRDKIWTASLLGLNLILFNVWFYPLSGLRLDLTEQKEFTISQTTRSLIQDLQEPLLIRGYISEKTHPLLAPLKPDIEDMLREYEIASEGKIKVEVLDPLEDPEIEAEANQTYGINPTPFQISGRNEASIINSYFDLLLRYGDQSVVLSYQDLIEIQQSYSGLEVRLRNLEYDLTSAIKKVVSGFQSIDSMLSALDQPVTLSLYLTPDTLPQQENEIVQLVEKVGGEIQSQSQGKFIFEVVNPDAQGSKVTRDTLVNDYGLVPFPTTLFSSDSYYFHLILQNGEKLQVIYPPNEPNEADVRTAIESALKRTSTGFLKVIGLWVPPQTPTQDMFGQMVQPISSYQLIREQLSQEYTVQSVDLTSGQVPFEVDALVVVAPQNMTDIEKFAIDQYLMRGGAVIIAATQYTLDSDPYQGYLMVNPVQGDVEDLLESYGVNLSQAMVMDQQNAAFPVVVARDAGGFQVQEIQAVNYPFFIDVRQNQMSPDSLISANLPALSMNWASPVKLDETKNASRETTELLWSSGQSWLTEDLNIQPDFDTYPEQGFAVGEEQGSHPLAVSVKGSFESYYKGQPAPETNSTADIVEMETAAQQENTVVEQSPDTARLVVIGSAGFIDDFALELSARLSQDYYLNNLQFIQNAVDWAVEDEDLLGIRSRGTTTRILNPLTDQQRTSWEITTIIVELVLLVVVFVYWQTRKRNEQPLQLLPVRVENREKMGKE